MPLVPDAQIPDGGPVANNSSQDRQTEGGFQLSGKRFNSTHRCGAVNAEKWVRVAGGGGGAAGEGGSGESLGAQMEAWERKSHGDKV